MFQLCILLRILTSVVFPDEGKPSIASKILIIMCSIDNNHTQSDQEVAVNDNQVDCYSCINVSVQLSSLNYFFLRLIVLLLLQQYKVFVQI